MKIFQTVLRFSVVLGLDRQQSTTQKYPINGKQVQTLSILCLSLSFCCAYLFLEAKTFEKFALSAYVSSVFLLGIVSYTISVWKNQSILNLFDNAEEIINES